MLNHTVYDGSYPIRILIVKVKDGVVTNSIGEVLNILLLDLFLSIEVILAFFRTITVTALN